MIPRPRRVFTNRTLNLRALKAVGYDMDYTLVHYTVEAWERRAYDRMLGFFSDRGWPVDGLEFDKNMMIRGLIIDSELGNIIKADRFGYVKQATHGTKPIPFSAMRETYSRVIVDLAESRFYFLNTLFSLSESCLYAQLVDRLDQQRVPEVIGYHDLFHLVRRAADDAHMEGRIKAEIVASPEKYVELDPDVPLALLDQKESGKSVLLITNSEWSYTKSMMEYTFDPFLPKGMGWRDVFDVIIVSARKPHFFTAGAPIFEVVSEDGLLKPSKDGIKAGGVYLGGNALHVEKYLGLSGDELLYVGDHIFGDVNVTKNIQRWRTALVVRELEAELEHEERFEPKEDELERLMKQKQTLEHSLSEMRLWLLRIKSGHGPKPDQKKDALERKITELRNRLIGLDQTIAPLAKEANELGESAWGPLMRAGNEKSHFARQVERHADVYTSRVANFLLVTPFAYLRSVRGSLPHDPDKG